jgi:REP element-mobilizing transposase RayT
MNRECIFGDISHNKMVLNQIRVIMNDEWRELPNRYPDIVNSDFIVMPNHLHGIITLGCRGGVAPPFYGNETNYTGVETTPLHGFNVKSVSPGAETTPLHLKSNLCKIIAFYKYHTTKLVNKISESPGMKIWQRNYYEHIIRDKTELIKIRQYIKHNPKNWDEDEDNPKNIVTKG